MGGREAGLLSVECLAAKTKHRILSFLVESLCYMKWSMSQLTRKWLPWWRGWCLTQCMAYWHTVSMIFGLDEWTERVNDGSFLPLPGGEIRCGLTHLAFYTTEWRVNTLGNISPFYGFVSRKEGRSTMFSEIVHGCYKKDSVCLHHQFQLIRSYIARNSPVWDSFLDSSLPGTKSYKSGWQRNVQASTISWIMKAKDLVQGVVPIATGEEHLTTGGMNTDMEQQNWQGPPWLPNPTPAAWRWTQWSLQKVRASTKVMHQISGSSGFGNQNTWTPWFPVRCVSHYLSFLEGINFVTQFFFLDFQINFLRIKQILLL